MERIYKMAKVVVVWLAERVSLEGGAGRIKGALEKLVREAEFMGYFEDVKTDSDAAWTIRLRFRESLQNLVASNKTLLPWLESIFSNEYWRRVWTAQEFAFGQRVLIQCGELSMNVQVLERVNALICDTAGDFIDPRRSPSMVRGFVDQNTPVTVESVLIFDEWSRTIGLLQDPNISYRIDLRKEVLRSGEGGSKKIYLYTLLVENSMALATKPVDKVFSLVNLATNCTLKADYSARLYEVCAKMTKYLIDELGSLEPLRFGRGERSDAEKGFPSWCPNWSLTHSNWERRLFGKFSCSGSTRPENSASLALNELTAHGIVLGRVQCCASIDGGSTEAGKSDDEILAECVQHGLCPSEPCDEDYESYERRGTYGDALMEVLTLENRVMQAREGDVTVNSIHIARIGRPILFKMDKGYVGRAFDKVTEGDLVCILKGSKAPCILKRKGKYWEYVSQAYGKATAL